MKLSPKNPPRLFHVGVKGDITLSDCGELALAPDELITLATPQGGQMDVARKDWGFYPCPSLNHRLGQFGLRPALVQNTGTGHWFLLVVEKDHEAAFAAYCQQENLQVMAWLDDPATLTKLTDFLARP